MLSKCGYLLFWWKKVKSYFFQSLLCLFVVLIEFIVIFGLLAQIHLDFVKISLKFVYVSVFIYWLMWLGYLLVCLVVILIWLFFNLPFFFVDLIIFGLSVLPWDWLVVILGSRIWLLIGIILLWLLWDLLLLIIRNWLVDLHWMILFWVKLRQVFGFYILANF